MNLAELADLVCETVRKPDSDSVAACKTYLKRRDQMLWDGNLWRDSLFTFTQALTPATDTLLAATGIVLLPASIDRVLALREADGPLPVQNLERYFMDTMDAFAQTGTPCEFSLLSPILYQFATAQAVTMEGASGTPDTSTQVRYLDADGVPQTTTAQPSTTPTSVGTVSEIVGVEKAAGSGAVTFKDASSNTILTVASSATRATPRQRLRLLPVPTASLTIRALVKQRYVPLASDYEEPRLRQAENVLIAYATGDMLRRSNKFGMANEAYAEGAALLAKLENIEFFQQAQRMQLVPEIEGNGFGSDVDFAGGTKGYW